MVFCFGGLLVESGLLVWCFLVESGLLVWCLLVWYGLGARRL